MQGLPRAVFENHWSKALSHSNSIVSPSLSVYYCIQVQYNNPVITTKSTHFFSTKGLCQVLYCTFTPVINALEQCSKAYGLCPDWVDMVPSSKKEAAKTIFRMDFKRAKSIAHCVDALGVATESWHFGVQRRGPHSSQHPGQVENGLDPAEYIIICFVCCSWI